jgi:hypothetical protein
MWVRYVGSPLIRKQLRVEGLFWYTGIHEADVSPVTDGNRKLKFLGWMVSGQSILVPFSNSPYDILFRMGGSRMACPPI